MKSITLNLDNTAGESLYEQIYNQVKDSILTGRIEAGSRLPSLRRFSDENGVSVTTVEKAYNQLLVEGYVESRPKSGYYVRSSIASEAQDNPEEERGMTLDQLLPPEGSHVGNEIPLLYDEESFEFGRWKKCMHKVFNEYQHLLRIAGDVQGEPALRYEIAKYLFQSRGVKCSPDQVVIGAGSQQLTGHLCRILQEMEIANAAAENPGYGPVREIFKEHGFTVLNIPVDENGIVLEKLPTNMRSIVYVNPSNQFPTGAVMPVARRYALINWAKENDSYILEDDYDSELRYFGKPIPALQGLDHDDRVIYLGSFSSTLFEAVKISYMVLPESMVEVFHQFSSKYSQTCSKAEQICLALYMEEGFYQKNIKKCRKLYAGKLETTMREFGKAGKGKVTPVNSRSGLAVLLKIQTGLSPEHLCYIGRKLGLLILPVDDLCTREEQAVTFYFYRVSNSLLKMLIPMFVKNIEREEKRMEQARLQEEKGKMMEEMEGKTYGLQRD